MMKMTKKLLPYLLFLFNNTLTFVIYFLLLRHNFFVNQFTTVAFITHIVISNYIVLKRRILFSNLYFFIFYYLSLISSLLIFSINNFLVILICWEVITYTSVFFIYNKKYFDNAYKYLITNLIGSACLITSVAMFYHKCHCFSFDNINQCDSVLTWFIIIAAILKSAQFPFHGWLLNAMSAPTVISALLHTCTVIGVGIFILMKFNPLMNHDQNLFLLFIGSISILLGSFLANFQSHLKKFLAFSTIANTGIIIILIGLQQYQMVQSFFIIHTLCKMFLFLIADNINNYNMLNSQQLFKYFKIEFIMTIIFAHQLGMFPYHSCKEIVEQNIIDVIIGNYNWSINIRTLFIYLIRISSIFTMSYWLRMIYLVFIKNNQYCINNKKIIFSSFYLLFTFISSVIIVFKNISIKINFVTYEFNHIYFLFGLMFFIYLLKFQTHSNILVNGLYCDKNLSAFYKIFVVLLSKISIFIENNFSWLLNCIYRKLLLLILNIEKYQFRLYGIPILFTKMNDVLDKCEEIFTKLFNYLYYIDKLQNMAINKYCLYSLIIIITMIYGIILFK